MPTWTPIVDVSHHQGVIDFNVMRRRGVVGLILRATIGTVLDRRVASYYRGALAAGFPAAQVGFYSFLNPKRADARTTAAVTAARIREITGRTDVLYMLDIESYRNEYPDPGTVTVRRAAFSAYIREHWTAFVAAMPGCRVIAYSNAAFWNGPDGPNDDDLAAELEWIVPRYPVHSVAGYDRVGRPGAPSTWDEWAFARAPGPFPPRGAAWAGWQFSADFNGQGPVYGCQSSALDLNIVDADAWERWTSTTPVDRPEVVPPPPAEEDDMQYLTDPYRSYDSRQGAGQLELNETRKIPVVFGRRAHVVITCVSNAGDRGWVSVAGEPGAVGDTSILNFEQRPGTQIRNGSAPLSLPDGHVYVRSTVPCHIIVDVFAVGA